VNFNCGRRVPARQWQRFAYGPNGGRKFRPSPLLRVLALAPTAAAQVPQHMGGIDLEHFIAGMERVYGWSVPPRLRAADPLFAQSRQRDRVCFTDWLQQTHVPQAWAASGLAFRAPAAWPRGVRLPCTPYALANLFGNMNWYGDDAPLDDLLDKDSGLPAAVLVAWTYGLPVDLLALTLEKLPSQVEVLLQRGAKQLASQPLIRFWLQNPDVEAIPFTALRKHPDEDPGVDVLWKRREALKAPWNWSMPTYTLYRKSPVRRLVESGGVPKQRERPLGSKLYVVDVREPE